MSETNPFFALPLLKAFTLTTRLLEACVLLVTGVWVFKYLGGVGFSPKELVQGKDTAPIFNWHPLLMALAFPVLMAEALLAYRAPVSSKLERPQRKIAHWVLHSAALLCILLGVTAAWKSHTLKLPAPIPNLYSVHSYLGLTTIILVIGQYAVGFVSYLYPQWSLATRKVLGPAHIYTGRITFVLGLATMAVGLQEKATFLQTLAKAPVFSPVIKLPGILVLLIALVGMGVMYIHSAPAGSVSRKAAVQDVEIEGLLHEPDERDA